MVRLKPDITETELLPYPGTWRRRLGEGDHFRLATVGTRRQDHAVRFDAHQLRRLQVEDDHHRFADQRIGLIRFGDAGDERAMFGADVYRELQQLLRLLDL